MKPGFLLITLSLALCCASPLLANDGPPGPPPVAVLKAALDLTEDQVTELEGLLQARADAIAATTELIRPLQAELKDLLQGDAPDPLEVGELTLEISALRGEIGQLQEDFLAGFEELLSPEQLLRVGNIQRIALANRAAEALKQLRFGR